MPQCRRCKKPIALRYGPGRRAVYCGASCRKADFDRRPTLRQFTCAECGLVFNHRGWAKSFRFCSKKCGEASSRSAQAARNRSSQRGEGITESIGLHELWVRDGGICHICGKLVEWDKEKTTNMASGRVNGEHPSRDHVMPVSKGGSNTRDNIKLAHLKCNGRKWNKVMDAPCGPINATIQCTKDSVTIQLTMFGDACDT